jgi:hypothetical protein
MNHAELDPWRSSECSRACFCFLSSPDEYWMFCLRDAIRPRVRARTKRKPQKSRMTRRPWQDTTYWAAAARR